MSGSFKERIETLSQQIFYNSEEAYKAGLDYVLSKIQKS